MQSFINPHFINKSRIVIKIGSSLLIRGGEFNFTWLESLALDIAELINSNIATEVVVVTSGAVAIGKESLKNYNINKKLSIAEKQAAAAIGQISLMSNYHQIFAKAQLNVAQILLSATDCNLRKSYQNTCNTIKTLVSNQIIPIINENDSVATEEIKIGDNDRLAARIAQMIDADLLILFSDIDGLYSENPNNNPKANFISVVKKISSQVELMAQGSSSSVGTGGMVTKIIAAKMATANYCNVIITSGIENKALSKLVKSCFNVENIKADNIYLEEENCNNSTGEYKERGGEGKKFTIFLANKQKPLKSSRKISKSKKNWLAGLISAKGSLFINDCAVLAMKSGKNSLLPIGVIAVEGNFKSGEVVFIKNAEGEHLGNGIVNYDSDIVGDIIKKNSEEISEIVGFGKKTILINAEYMVIFSK